jgi:hypothetical protein
MSRSSSIAVVFGLAAGFLACSSSTGSSLPAGSGGSGGSGGSATQGGSSNSASGSSNLAGSSNAASGSSNVSGSGGLSAGGTSGSSGAGGASSGGSGGSGGSAGNGTSMSGSSGFGGAGGNATGGSAGAAGSSGAMATGLSVLTVPLAAATDKAHFLITLGSAVNLSGATISFHVNVHAGTSGVFQAYLQHGGSPDYNQLYQGWQKLSDLSGWQDVVWVVASTANPSTFDETTVARLGIEIGGGSAADFSATTDVVYVDSISLSGGIPAAGPWTFDTTGSISATAFPAADILWLNAASTDTTATGATLTWLSGP